MTPLEYVAIKKKYAEKFIQGILKPEELSALYKELGGPATTVNITDVNGKEIEIPACRAFVKDVLPKMTREAMATMAEQLMIVEAQNHGKSNAVLRNEHLTKAFLVGEFKRRNPEFKDEEVITKTLQSLLANPSKPLEFDANKFNYLLPYIKQAEPCLHESMIQDNEKMKEFVTITAVFTIVKACLLSSETASKLDAIPLQRALGKAKLDPQMEDALMTSYNSQTNLESNKPRANWAGIESPETKTGTREYSARHNVIKNNKNLTSEVMQPERPTMRNR